MGNPMRGYFFPFQKAKTRRIPMPEMEKKVEIGENNVSESTKECDMENLPGIG